MVKDIANSEVEEWTSHTRKLDMVTSSSHRSARALQRHDTDTLIGIIFTSTALRAGAILVYLYHIPFGDDTSSVSSVYWVWARLASQRAYFTEHLKLLPYGWSISRT